MKLNPIYCGILCCSLAAPLSVSAQPTGDAIEEIVVTGSLIRGTPEDAALPVEVHTIEAMRLSGAPTALEFAKSLPSQGPVTGEAYYFGGAALTGNVRYNLRGIGEDKTLSLFNGRRIAQNTSIIPAAALSRIEVLKDGAAVTYGADATGGVVNFITKKNFKGFEVDASYKLIDDSDGDYNISLLGGFGGDRTNILWAAEWEHRSELNTTDRRFASRPYRVNPAPTSTLTNLTSWFPHGALPDATAPGYDPKAQSRYGTSEVFVNTGEFGGLLGAAVADFDPASCEAVGGFYDGVPGARSCRYNYAPFYNLVEDQDIYRIYTEVNSQVSDKMDFYLRLGFSRVYLPSVEGSPSQPVIRGPAVNEGAVGQFYVPRSNPFFQDFAERSGLVNITHPVSGANIYGAVGGVSALTYRAFAHGGNPTFAEGDNSSVGSEIDNKYWHLSTGLNGEFENGLGYDFAVTYNHTNAFADSPDLIAYRLQEALNGFGGPNCHAADLDPARFGTQNPAAAGTGGCMWYNPFATNFVGQPILGLANPAYRDASTLNSAELVRWLFDDRGFETISDNVTVDLVLTDDMPLALPGGNIAWAAGVQWRKLHRREFVEGDLYNGNQPCVWPNAYGQVPRSPADPDYNGCTPDEPGPFQFFGTNVPDRNSQEQRSAFFEFNFPILDSLYLTAAARYEEFSGGLDTTVYKVSGQWQATENLSFRGAYGTNYQAPGIAVTPGEVDNAVRSYTIAGGSWLGSQIVTLDNIEPETATVWSAGVIWQSQGFTSDSDFRIILDYFNIETEDELGLVATADDIASAVFAGGKTNCAHPLAGRVTFNGACVQGADPNFASIRTDYGNGPGQHTAGFDISVDYGMPFMQGELRFGLNATKLEKFKFTETVMDGVVIKPAENRLGKLNFATVGSAAAEWRTNFHVNYARDIHNFRLVFNYVSGVDDYRYINSDGSLNEGLLTVDGQVSTFGVRGDHWLVADFHYNLELPGNSTLRFSINNLADEEPPASRQELGYDPRIGNPLMRTFELGFQKRF